MILIMTALTLVIYLAHDGCFMRGLLGMTAITALRGLSIFLAGLMTFSARNFSVLPMQGKIC